jgi:phosphate acetyltransferase
MFEQMISQIKGEKIKIVYPEGMDERIVEACAKLKEEDLLEPIIIGNPSEVKALAQKIGVSIEGIELVDPTSYEQKGMLLEQLTEIRNGKNTEEELTAWLEKGNYLGTMMVKAGLADGLVGGATYSTGDTVRPSLQIVKTKPGISKVSSSMVMVRGDEKYIMGDCAINIAPTSEDLAEMAVECAKTAKVFGIDPRVALLSFSTMGSGKSPQSEKVANAKLILDQTETDFAYDGELQFDAAFVPSVGKKKAPNSEVAGSANTFVFPSLEAANIGYKLVQRLAGFDAVGPILQGLNAPINDLSRGCSVDDIYKLSIITAMQTK